MKPSMTSSGPSRRVVVVVMVGQSRGCVTHSLQNPHHTNIFTTIHHPQTSTSSTTSQCAPLTQKHQHLLSCVFLSSLSPSLSQVALLLLAMSMWVLKGVLVMQTQPLQFYLTSQ